MNTRSTAVARGAMRTRIKAVARSGVAAGIAALVFVACQDAGPTRPVQPDVVLRAANPNPGVLPRNARPFGKTYEEWTVAYRQWLAAIPAASNPGVDLTGEFCGEGQSGPVWFLASHIGGPATVVRDCQVPAGKALYVPLVGFIAWAPEDVGRASAVLEAFLGLDPTTMTDEEIIRVGVNWFIDLVTDLSLTVNGVAYDDLFSYRAETPVFNFAATDLYDDIGLPVSESSLVVADGFALILRPLPPGSHTIEIRAESRDHPIVEFGDAIFDVTYHLTVGTR